MPSKITYTCAVCGAIKGEVNHWYSYSLQDDEVRLGSFAMLDIYEIDETDCVCGQKCLHVILDRWLAAQRSPKEKES
jgi:endogenous inhibitor of DNA gyrase (YacG/DUF329 family)